MNDNGILDVIQRLQIKAAREFMGERMDHRALDFVDRHPGIIGALVGLRVTGTCSLSAAVVRRLCAVGIFAADEDGYYMSPVMEDLIDDVLRAAQQGKGDVP